METLWQIDWERLIMPSTPFLEIVLRGSITYLALFVLLRLILKRQAGTVGITDLLVVVLIADAAQNAMADDYHSITDGLLLVTTIVFWSHMLNWFGYRFPRFQRFFHPPPLPLVEEGSVLRHNLRRELITRDELMSQLREQGVDDLTQVKRAFMEGDGHISVITYNGGSHGVEKRRLL